MKSVKNFATNKEEFIKANASSSILILEPRRQFEALIPGAYSEEKSSLKELSRILKRTGLGLSPDDKREAHSLLSKIPYLPDSLRKTLWLKGSGAL